MLDRIRLYWKLHHSRDKAYYKALDGIFGVCPNNIELYKLALIHRSASLFLDDGTPINNERLEFLGDAVLGMVTADYLFHRHPDLPEGDLTRIRAALVCEQSLHEVAQRLGLGEYIKLGHGEELGGGRKRPSILADATESVFAAVYLDGGMEQARRVIHYVLLDREREEAVEERRRDFKTELQELVQRRSDQKLSYEMVGASGPDHAKVFECCVQLNGEVIGSGTGHSKKEAEQAAARAALAELAQ